MNLSLSRRRMLAGMALTGAAGVCGLFSQRGLARMAMAGTQDTAKLKVVFMVSPDGMGVDEFLTQTAWNGAGIWHPKSAFDIREDFDTEAFELNEVSSIFADHRKRSVYLRGGVANFVNGNANTGHAGYFSVLRDSSKSHTSIDNLIAAQFSKDDPGKPLLYSGPHTITSNNWHTSWINDDMLTPQPDPGVLYEEVFGRARLVPRARPLNASILDPVEQDIKDIRQLLGGSELAKFDTHLDALAKVRSDLLASGSGSSCERTPPDITGLEINGVKDRTRVTELHMDVVAQSLACGTRRVANIQMSASTETLNFPDIDSKRNPHDLAHWGLFGMNPGQSSRNEWVQSRQWYAKRVAYFLDQLEKFRDPDVPGDSLADHTLVIYTSEMSDGYKEHCQDMPIVMFGGQHTPLITKENGRYLSILSQGEVDWKDQVGWTPRALGLQRIWATLADSIGFTVPYDGNITPVTSLFKSAA